jgi:hypothetical protein
MNTIYHKLNILYYIITNRQACDTNKFHITMTKYFYKPQDVHY